MNIIKKRITELILKDIYALNDLDLPEFKAGLAEYKKKHKLTSAPPERIKSSMNITHEHIGGGICYKAVHKSYRSEKTVLFLHGGGLFAEALGLHWDFVMRLARDTGCTVIFPQYPLVPESNSEECHEMIFEVYKQLIEQVSPKDLTIIGDSAGGTLALSLSMMARDRGLPLANELVLISPGFVIECADEAERARLEEIKKQDFIIGKFPIEKIQKLWQGSLADDDYRTDVTKGSIEGLPRITMFSGTSEIMNIPARHFAKRLRESRHPYYYGERKGGLHDYALSSKYKTEYSIISGRVTGKTK